MIPSIIVMGPGGGVDFNTARSFIVNNWDQFPQFLKQFDLTLLSLYAGARKFDSDIDWPSFRCPGGCNRVLPLDCADLDHDRARTNICYVRHQGKGGLSRANTQSNWDVHDEGAFFIVNYANAKVDLVNYVYAANQITFQKPGFQTVATVPLIDLLKCDATNLQPLCPRCNRSKGGSM